jgi:uncharacterized Ntn-hydrolase superfamily protein
MRWFGTPLLAAVMLLTAPGCVTPTSREHTTVATFSIVAYDPASQELGIAVQSKFIAVGAVVPWARAGVGAVATQARANTSYGPEGLALLEKGLSAKEVVTRLTEKDPNRAVRQLGVVDSKGRVATYTGDKCFEWAGGVQGKHYVAQGNILASESVTREMGKAFEGSTGDLADRLVAALAAGQKAGGDRRGRQSAALLVVRAGAGYGGNDRYRDLRVDDHPKPIEELRRLLGLHKRVFPPPTER